MPFRPDVYNEPTLIAPTLNARASSPHDILEYKHIERALEAKIYFATPHHAWERGTNENTNGLIRQYLPKGTSLARLTQDRCHQIASSLNHRPRKRLGFRTPFEVYHKSVLPRRR